MPEKKDVHAQEKQKIIDAAMILAAERGWNAVTMREIAVRAEMPVARVFDLFEDKSDILSALGRMIDRRVLEGLGPVDEDLSPRDRLFDLMMDRYEILGDYREGILAVVETFKCDPKQAIITAPHLCRSMSWMLDAAGVETSGVKGAMKVAGLTGVYLKVLRVWAKEESPDMPKTMAALDQELSRAERWADILGF